MRRRLKFYLDTSVFGSLYDFEDPRRVEITRSLMEPERFRDDARHIAIPVFYELDALISWNYRHMVNIRVKRMVNAVNLRLGYKPIEILSPEEVIGYGEVES